MPALCSSRWSNPRGVRCLLCFLIKENFCLLPALQTRLSSCRCRFIKQVEGCVFSSKIRAYSDQACDKDVILRQLSWYIWRGHVVGERVFLECNSQESQLDLWVKSCLKTHDSQTISDSLLARSQVVTIIIKKKYNDTEIIYLPLPDIASGYLQCGVHCRLTTWALCPGTWLAFRCNPISSYIA